MVQKRWPLEGDDQPAAHQTTAVIIASASSTPASNFITFLPPTAADLAIDLAAALAALHSGGAPSLASILPGGIVLLRGQHTGEVIRVLWLGFIIPRSRVSEFFMT